LTSYVAPGSISLHHCWPLKQAEEYKRFRELAGPKGESSIIVSLCTDWTKKQQGSTSEEPQATNVQPKIGASKDELETYLSQLSLEELANMQAWGLRVNRIANEKWKEKKHSAITKKKSFLEEVAAAVGTESNKAEV
jgi:hypothetical protein